MKNTFGEFFLVIPGMADLKKQFNRLHKVLGHSMCKFNDHFCNT